METTAIEKQFRPASSRAAVLRWSEMDSNILVSCLMVSKNNIHFVSRAVGCYQSLVFPEAGKRELIIVSVDERPEIAPITASDPSIRFIHHPNATLGELRNVAVEQARGEFVATWDDDDWHHPLRLKLQFDELTRCEAQICYLSRVTLACPTKNQYRRSIVTLWFQTLLGRRSTLLSCPYSSLPRGEHNAQFSALSSKAKLCYCENDPNMYIYVFHDCNTLCDDLDRFENLTDKSAALFSDPEIDSLRKLVSP